jgi:EAL domain-containing protein (putative c-di-GMP-specific phosphodiesterase class I)
MDVTRLRLAELLRLVLQLFPVRNGDQYRDPVPDEPLEAADERLATGLCMIAESLGSSEAAVLEVLRKANIEVRQARHTADIRRLVADRMPDFVITGPGADATRVARALSDAGYKGPLQQVGAASSTGSAPPQGIRVLPAISVNAVDTDLFAVLLEDGMVRGRDGLVSVDLTLAARKGWLQFWYLPKIDLRQSRLHGAELVPRIYHPRHGILDPGKFEVADKDDRRILGYSAIRAAMKDWAAFHSIGFNMEFSTNFSIDAFDGREVAALIDGVRPASRRWKGLRIELDTRTQALDQTQVEGFKQVLRTDRVTLALDHVVGAEQIEKLDDRLAEVKLDECLIAGCAEDLDKQNLLVSIMAVVSQKNAIAVATGLKYRADLRYIVKHHEVIRFGQGSVFSPAVSRSQFVRLLQARAGQAGARVADTNLSTEMFRR